MNPMTTLLWLLSLAVGIFFAQPYVRRFYVFHKSVRRLKRVASQVKDPDTRAQLEAAIKDFEACFWDYMRGDEDP